MRSEGCACACVRWGSDGWEGCEVRSWGDLKHVDGTPNHLIFFTDCLPPPPPGREFSTGVLHLQPLDILKACQDLRIQARGSLGGGETRVARGEGCC